MTATMRASLLARAWRYEARSCSLSSAIWAAMSVPVPVPGVGLGLLLAVVVVVVAGAGRAGAGAGVLVGSSIEEPSPSEMGRRPLGMVTPFGKLIASPRARRARVVAMGSCPIGAAGEVPGGELRRTLGAVLVLLLLSPARGRGKGLGVGVGAGFAATAVAPGIVSLNGAKTGV